MLEFLQSSALRAKFMSQSSLISVSYTHLDVYKRQVPERSHLNVHFKRPDSGYLEQFEQMEANGIISTRGIKEGAFRSVSYTHLDVYKRQRVFCFFYNVDKRSIIKLTQVLNNHRHNFGNINCCLLYTSKVS